MTGGFVWLQLQEWIISGLRSVAGCRGFTLMTNLCQWKWIGFETNPIDFTSGLHSSPATRINARQMKPWLLGPLLAGERGRAVTPCTLGLSFIPAGSCQRNHSLRVVHTRLKPQNRASYIILPQPTSAAAQRSTERLPKSYQNQCFRVFLEISSMQNQQQRLSMDPCVCEKRRWEPTCGRELSGAIWGPALPHRTATATLPWLPASGGKSISLREAAGCFTQVKKKKSSGYHWQERPWMQYFMAVSWKGKNITHFTG